MTGDDITQNQRSRPSRRTLLQTAGACGLAGALTACTSASGQPPTTGTGTGTPTGTTTPAAASPTAAASSGTILASTTDVPVGGGIITAGVLVVQPTAGAYKAFDAACPHRGVQVGPPQNGISTCPAHHSTFAIADGARLTGPATQGLTEIAISVQKQDIVRT